MVESSREGYAIHPWFICEAESKIKGECIILPSRVRDAHEYGSVCEMGSLVKEVHDKTSFAEVRNGCAEHATPCMLRRQGDTGRKTPEGNRDPGEE